MDLKFQLHVNDRMILRGDGNSCAVIYNNLVGLNFDGEELRNYREYMGAEYFSDKSAFSDGTRVAFLIVDSGALVDYTLGSPEEPKRITMAMVEGKDGGFAKLQENYPALIAERYSASDPLDWSDPLHPENPLLKSRPHIKTEVRSLGVQHFAVFSVSNGDSHDEKLFESKSDKGRTAFDEAVLFAESLGLPWRNAGSREIFDPATGRVWLL